MPDEKEGISLKVLIGGVLQALREAKYLGDIESTKLLDTYKTGNLSSFSVPAFTISDVEVELRCSIVGTTNKQEKEGRIEDLKVNVSADRLKDLGADQISVMKIKISPVSLRVFEEESK